MSPVMYCAMTAILRNDQSFSCMFTKQQYKCVLIQCLSLPTQPGPSPLDEKSTSVAMWPRVSMPLVKPAHTTSCIGASFGSVESCPELMSLTNGRCQSPSWLNQIGLTSSAAT